MATPASLNFTPFTDVRIMFPNFLAANNFFAAITVTLTSANIPAAVVDGLGGVKQLEIAAFAVTPQANNYVNIIIDDGATQQGVPTKEAFIALTTQVNSLVAWLTALDAQMRAKGFVSL